MNAQQLIDLLEEVCDAAQEDAEEIEVYLASPGQQFDIEALRICETTDVEERRGKEVEVKRHTLYIGKGEPCGPLPANVSQVFDWSD